MNILSRLFSSGQKATTNTHKYTEKYDVADKTLLESVVKVNRDTLSTVTEWLPAEVKAGSYFNYGVPGHIEDLLSLNIGDEITYSDLVLYYSRLIQNVNYLELGVSVGKNFLQFATYLQNASLTGFDIENINPVIGKKFDFLSIDQWQTMAGSIRKEDSCIKSFKFNQNKVNYLAGDIWDEGAWEKLSGQKFNILFSDALHDPKALLWEYEMIQKYKLLDDTFIIFWDDLNNGLEQSFFTISENLLKKYDLSSSQVKFIKINGWLGKNYPHKHDIGMVSNLILK